MYPDPKLQEYLENRYGAENVHFVGQSLVNVATYQIRTCEYVWETKRYVKK